MASATQAGFNYDLFKKRVRLFDSDRDGERNVAISQSLRQCAEHDPPLLFWEAVSQAFGGGINADHERLKSDFEQLKTVASGLNEENRRLLDEVNNLRQARHVSDWPDMWFLQPKPLLIALGIAVAIDWLVTLPVWGLSDNNAFIVGQWIHMPCIALFLLWSMAVFKCEGSQRLMGFWLMWGGSWTFLVSLGAWFHGGRYKNASTIKLMMLPTFWWSDAGMPYTVFDTSATLLVLAFVVDLICGVPVTYWLIYNSLKWLTKLVEMAIWLFGVIRTAMEE